MRTIGFEDGEAGLDWLALCDALEAGHAFPKGSIEDSFLYRGNDTILAGRHGLTGWALVKRQRYIPVTSVGRPMICGP